jgi:hypothetical protein
MKKIYIIILVCIGFIANAQIQKEDFNTSDLPKGWSITQPKSGCTWEFGNKGKIIGSGFQNPATFPSGGVIFNDYKCGDFKNNIIELISPVVNLIESNIIASTIELTYNLQTFSGDGNFKINVWNGNSWENIWIDSEDTKANQNGKNKKISIDVSEYINSAFRVKFIYDDEDSLTWGLGIDDYKLTGIAASKVEGLERIGFNYYPNPVINDELTLVSSEKISTVNVYNSLGQRVISKKPLALQSKLKMQKLNSGAYIVTVLIGETEGSFKIIKK